MSPRRDGRGGARSGRARSAGPQAPPSAAGRAALGAYALGSLTVHALGQSLRLDVPRDVFSTQRIDEGTQLLLGHLPRAPPRSVLDLGCGYGALGLPVAAAHPAAQAVLVDRDLLAVAAAAHNAAALGLANVAAAPGLGFRDLAAGASFDWVLCNVPARIGAAAIGYFLEGGAARLNPGGELRVVVIRDLRGTVEAEAAARGLGGLALAAEGPRHAVYALPAAGRPRAALDHESIYARDRVALATPDGPLALERPQDASEDPAHAHALALLFEALPRAAPRRLLAFRAAYGAVPLFARRRWPAAQVVAQDRDLLDACFLERNAKALALDGPLLIVKPALELAGAAAAPLDLVLGELSGGGGPEVAARELLQAAELLGAGGQALVVLSARQEREWFPSVLPRAATAAVLVRRGAMSLLRLAPRAPSAGRR